MEQDEKQIYLFPIKSWDLSHRRKEILILAVEVSFKSFCA